MESKNNVDTTETTSCLEWCAGYGGISLGLKRAIPSLRTIAFGEIEAFACANLVAKMEAGLLDAAPIWTDIKTFPCESFRDRVDIFVAGYPCQPFSAAGKRLGAEDPRHLWPHIARAISIIRPRLCFFENVEGHISLGLSTVISDLEELGYKVSWGIFSASEVGAPHQRKRVFILAYDQSFGIQGCGAGWLQKPRPHAGQALPLRGGDAGRDQWPSRPGEPQHEWEPPRVVADSRCGKRDGGQNCERTIGAAQSEFGEASAMGNAAQRKDHGRESRDLGQAAGEGRCGDDAADGAGEEPHQWQTQPSLGLHSNESSGFLGQALTLNPYGDNVYPYENISKKIRAREVLFSLWREAISKEIQWTAGGLQCFLAEKILQSGMQLDSFTQRICYFVWCIQTSHEAQGWGLHGMWVYENCRNSSQGQKPIEQFKRELGYAMCQLSYEIALEGRKDAVETEGILQGVREASERAWALSQALPEMEEVWRSSLDQKVWEKGCYIEATSIGNRTDELRLLGNGVVPATAERAFRVLIEEINK